MKRVNIMNNKESGILFHISSLPSKYGVGTFGKVAYDFVDFLNESKIHIWQILPLNLTSFGDSPYQSPSNYGFNIYFIDLDLLTSQGLLKEDEYSSINFGSDPSRVDYASLFNNRIKLLKLAFSRFKSTAKFKSFLKTNLNSKDFSFFMVLKELNNYSPWNMWDKKFRNYSAKTEQDVIENNYDLYCFYMWTQYEFLNQYFKLKDYANSKNIKIMGDIPIYLAYDSVECYKYPQMFQFDKNKNPTRVAGCPPDCFSADGQLWGNPLYNWEYLKSTGYKWRNDRIADALKLYDLLRIDHFRGFSAYYSIPAKDTTARNGKWVKGPGFDLFKDKLNLPIVAEDLGLMDKDFEIFMKECGFPGMKIITQGLLNSDIDNSWRPRNYTSKFFSYTSTHDSETAMQFINQLTDTDRLIFLDALSSDCQYFGIDFDRYVSNYELLNKIIELNYATKASVVCMPFQDLLGLGKEARMNLPSTLSTKNWSWRLTISQFENNKTQIIQNLSRLAKKYNRL